MMRKLAAITRRHCHNTSERCWRHRIAPRASRSALQNLMARALYCVVPHEWLSRCDAVLTTNPSVRCAAQRCEGAERGDIGLDWERPCRRRDKNTQPGRPVAAKQLARLAKRLACEATQTSMSRERSMRANRRSGNGALAELQICAGAALMQHAPGEQAENAS